MSIYLKKFLLPLEKENMIKKKRKVHNGGLKLGYYDNSYPCDIFVEKELKEISFDRITIFYGTNGSGKSTLLNLIAQKLKLIRIAPYNSGEMFDSYVEACQYDLGFDEYGEPLELPSGSRIITSDDVFDYMLTVRTNNSEISENIEIARKKWKSLKFGDSIKFNSLDDYEALRLQLLARKKSLTRRQFIKQTAGKETVLKSNGETALYYFDQKLENDKLYCLDEPENSLSPKMQLKLVQLLEEVVRYCGCQLIIATHSPFLLALNHAKIYNLDCSPVITQNWWELENTRIYFEFFHKNRKLFD